ncbi:MAG TPA: hypothetical protein VFL84_04705, partial [Gammaproteobacteria bacterium]|nr:hypothetical protein [Gammaproteobacteria bacterium]
LLGRDELIGAVPGEVLELRIVGESDYQTVECLIELRDEARPAASFAATPAGNVNCTSTRLASRWRARCARFARRNCSRRGTLLSGCALQLACARALRYDPRRPPRGAPQPEKTA